MPLVTSDVRSGAGVVKPNRNKRLGTHAINNDWPTGARNSVGHLFIGSDVRRTRRANRAAAAASHRLRPRAAAQGLSEDERYVVADDVVHRLQQHGDPWRLSEELSDTTGKGFSTPPNKDA